MFILVFERNMENIGQEERKFVLYMLYLGSILKSHRVVLPITKGIISDG